eukprot:CAMPEP_0197630988 /NCGR_PEP_ID=MMETSP1338-20131121/8304_1 /TAXON_ID=43686 ORGANISM="Pelagodinium beii, Strain RCC1491" /NCGR_SAMPLE_ID=MMETSP1338 /ASSEMBLY_ACC=CAM_ASM_000754 /LENGTH=396 /DNA_ID=CAMNT_0043202345 /DNA_START=88 /DNA_END=1278 /DNA_ORIENTATION=-
MSSLAPGFTDLLRKQLAVQHQLLDAQRQSVEIQQLLLESALSQKPDVTSSAPEILPATEKEERIPLSPRPIVAVDLAAGSAESFNRPHHLNIGPTCSTFPGSGIPDSQNLTHPWHLGPIHGTRFRFWISSLHIIDFFWPHAVRTEAYDAVFGSKSTVQIREMLARNLANYNIYSTLLLTITTALFFEQSMPTTRIDMAFSVLSFLLVISNAIFVVLVLFCLSIMDVVSDVNLLAWLLANKALLALISIACNTVSWRFLGMAIIHALRMCSAFDGLATIGTATLAAELISLIIMVAVCMTVINVASRSALYSGAFGEVQIPAFSPGSGSWNSEACSSKFFAAALGGLTLKRGILEYYDVLLSAREEASRGSDQVKQHPSSAIRGLAPNVFGSTGVRL